MITKHLLNKEADSLIVFKPIPHHEVTADAASKMEYLFLYNKNENVTELLQLLEKIKGACNIEDESMSQVLEVDPDLSIPFNLLGFERLQTCVIFGLSPTEIGLNCQHQLHQPMVIRGNTLLFTVGLKKLSTSQDLKKRLWVPLKSIFS
jgi:hypothetical protein